MDGHFNFFQRATSGTHQHCLIGQLYDLLGRQLILSKEAQQACTDFDCKIFSLQIEAILNLAKLVILQFFRNLMIFMYGNKFPFRFFDSRECPVL